jgi:hypothetical protein
MTGAFLPLVGRLRLCLKGLLVGALALAGVGALALAGGSLVPAIARASTAQESMLQDDAALLRDPVGTLQAARNLGITRMRVGMRWMLVAPNPNTRRKPRAFRSADPGAYPDILWSVWDTIVTQARQDGISLNVDLEGGAPLWATGRGAPRGSAGYNWEPSASEFGAFVRAVATRYSGNYNPRAKMLDPGNSGDLPAVHFWSVWNEPDYGPSLAPQGVPGQLGIENSPRMYRNLVDAAWAGLRATGHAHDTVLIGELAPRGYAHWGLFSGMKPLVFLRALYCLDSSYRQLQGSAAAARGCPTTAAGSARFRSAHPGLFGASGVADHPYMRWYRPNREAVPDPDYSTLGEIGSFSRSLDRVLRAYGSRQRLPIYNTEFGYITSPPKHPTPKAPYVSPATAALYINWAEYLSWRNPRLRSFMQYLIFDPLPALRSNDWGGFASGLYTFRRRPKTTRDAFRLPLYLPVRTAHQNQSLEVWGDVRPAPYAAEDVPSSVQTAEIQFRPAGSDSFTTLDSVNVTDPHGYIDEHIPFPSSGSVRLAWSYPVGDALLGDGSTIYSRTVNITVR